MELRRDFIKSDLKDGMIVETRRGTLLMVLGDNIISNECWASLGRYDKDLIRYESRGDDYRDIMKVYLSQSNQTMKHMFENKALIWERHDYKEMSIDEIEKELGYKIKILD